MISSEGYELILGSSIDSQFGPVLLFGAGGQLVEVFQDRALALPPLNTTLARRFIEQTKIFTALKGVRGRKPVDIAALQELLVQVQPAGDRAALDQGNRHQSAAGVAGAADRAGCTGGGVLFPTAPPTIGTAADCGSSCTKPRRTRPQMPENRSDRGGHHTAEGRKKGTSPKASADAPADAPSPPPTAPAADATLTRSFFYSSRSAVIGSSRDARRAGKKPAKIATEPAFPQQSPASVTFSFIP